jgi:HEAT repeat protein/cyclophilin family peptidyl-prolyl cis-trans isomerase
MADDMQWKRLRETTIAFALFATACASAPTVPATPVPTFEQKMASILRLEDQRILRDPAPAAPEPPPESSGGRPSNMPVPPPGPDLVRLLGDSEGRIRRRASLAIGRVGSSEGVQPLVTLLSDPEPEVRHMAAFALGLIGDRAAIDPLVAALDDASPLVQGTAAEALGLIGDPMAAAAVGGLALRIVKSGALAEMPGADADSRRDLPSSAFRQALYALVRLNAYDQVAAAVLDEAGQPTVRWWPVAYALQRLGDRRALAALLTLTRESHPYARAFAAKGLGALKDSSAVSTLVELTAGTDHAVVVESVRALGQIGDASAAPLMIKLIQSRDTHVQVRREAVEALGNMRAPDTFDFLLDWFTDPNPAIRAAAIRSAAAIDPDQFVIVLSGLDPDAAWNVRAATAGALATMPGELAIPRVRSILDAADQRVVPAALDALVKLRAPETAEVLTQHLQADDAVVRAAAATGLGELRPAGGEALLAAAYEFGQRDASYVARSAALTALARYGSPEAVAAVRQGLADKDWAVRRRAAGLLKELDPSAAAEVDQLIRPAPNAGGTATYQEPSLVNPAVSPLLYLDTDRGTIEIELAVLDAPLTVRSLMLLARDGFFDGLRFHRVVPNFVIQGGDPRGDGEGGPGYTIRDELNDRMYLRGTVGMALDQWGDTGGSQFFITHSPQPHLDARYTVVGRVTGGMDVVDQIQQDDVIRRATVWDGQTTTPAPNPAGVTQ